jgi:hypothetical protein
MLLGDVYALSLCSHSKQYSDCYPCMQCETRYLRLEPYALIYSMLSANLQAYNILFALYCTIAIGSLVIFQIGVGHLVYCIELRAVL